MIPRWKRPKVFVKIQYEFTGKVEVLIGILAASQSPFVPGTAVKLDALITLEDPLKTKLPWAPFFTRMQKSRGLFVARL